MNLEAAGKNIIFCKFEMEKKNSGTILLLDDPKTQYFCVLSMGIDVPETKVQKGDICLLKYPGQMFNIDNEEYFISEFENILAIVNQE